MIVFCGVTTITYLSILRMFYELSVYRVISHHMHRYIYVYTSDMSSSGAGGLMMGGSGELDIGFDQGTSAITSLQTHPQTGQILVTSKLGEVNLV